MVVRRKQELVSGSQEKSSSRATVELSNIVELQKILTVCNMLRENQQIDLLVNRIMELEKNYADVMQELDSVKERLSELESKDKSLDMTSGGIASKLVKEANVKMNRQYHSIQNMKKDLNVKAGQLVQNFKDKGIKSLNKVCQFLGIKEKLVELREVTVSRKMDAKETISKIENIQNELGLAKLHMKNAGRTIADKEQLNPAQVAATKRGLIYKGLNHIKMSYCNQVEKYAAEEKRLDKAIEKFDALEGKASVLGKLSDNKKELSEKDSAAKEETMCSEHKHDDIER